MKDSVDILGKLKKEYVQATDHVSEHESRMSDINIALAKMLDTNSQDYASWASPVRASAYSTSGGISVGLAIADILGCLGLCSSIGNVANWGTTISNTEATIAS